MAVGFGLRGKGKKRERGRGKRERNKRGRRREKGGKCGRRKEGGEEITSPGSSFNPTDGMSRFLGRTTQAWWGCLFRDRFSLPWRKVSCFLCKLLPCAVCSFRPVWKCVWGLQGSCVVLIPPAVLAHFSISFLCLHWTVLCLSPGTRTRTFALEKRCPTSTQPLLQTHLVLSHNNPWLLSTILGSYYQQSMVGFTSKQLGIWDVHISLLSSVLLHHCRLSASFFTWSVYIHTAK